MLDREQDIENPNYGVSEFPITPSAEWADWLDEHLGSNSDAWQNRKLVLPANLFLYATMNTSDQNLFPMDTAFRRRWGMVYQGVQPSPTLSTMVPLTQDDRVGVPWRELLVPLNAAIVEHKGNDDKQMGPWFVKPRKQGQIVDAQEFVSKVLFYLWSDVFRDEPRRVFVDEVRTYDGLVQRFQTGKTVLRKDILRMLPSHAAPVTPEATSMLPSSDAGSGG